MTENVGDVNEFKKMCKQRHIDSSQRKWCSTIKASGKARHCRFISPTLQVTNYVNYSIPLQIRISLSKLKCSVHSLNIEVGPT